MEKQSHRRRFRRMCEQIMGIYKIHWLEIARAINEALEQIEGDFGKKEFKKALDFISKYGCLCDATQEEFDDWIEYAQRLEGEEDLNNINNNR